MSARFRLQGVSVSYAASEALTEVDLELEAGDRVALVGPSGSGKTTLLRLLNGGLRPTAGQVEVDGEDLAVLSPGRLRDLRASLAFIPQDLHLVPSLRVVKNVLSGRLGRWSLLRSLRVMLWPPRDLLLEVHEILARVGIPEKLYQRTDTLSGGQRQRVAVARALFQRPRALLADEPVSSVDPARARETVAMLSRICREHRLTLCASLHNLELARDHFTRLVGLRRGRVLFDRRPQEVAAHELEALYRLAESGDPGEPGAVEDSAQATEAREAREADPPIGRGVAAARTVQDFARKATGVG